jgi:hypothetical protein
VATLIPLTFDSNLGYYIATFNPATRTYLEEPNLNTTTIPDGIFVNDWYFLITNSDQSRQSADLKGSDYGFGASTLSLSQRNISEDIIIGSVTITLKSPAQYNITVYDVLGKKIKQITLNVNTQLTHDFQLQNTGIYLVKIKSGNAIQTLKMLRY